MFWTHDDNHLDFGYNHRRTVCVSPNAFLRNCVIIARSFWVVHEMWRRLLWQRRRISYHCGKI